MIKFNTDTRILLLLAACIELWSAKRELIKVNAETNHLIVSQVAWCSLNLCLVYSWFGTIHFGHKIVSYLCFMDVFAVFRKWSNYCLTPFKQLSLCPPWGSIALASSQFFFFFSASYFFFFQTELKGSILVHFYMQTLKRLK